MIEFVCGFAIGIIFTIAASYYLHCKNKKNKKWIMIELNDHAD